jgi:hypothetical protein
MRHYKSLCVPTYRQFQENVLFAVLWDKNHTCQQALTLANLAETCLPRTVRAGCFIGHNITTNCPFSFHINKDKRLEAYGGPNSTPPPPPEHHPRTHCRQINWATWQGMKYLLQADLRKADWRFLPVSSQSIPSRGLATLELQLRHQMAVRVSTTSVA